MHDSNSTLYEISDNKVKFDHDLNIDNKWKKTEKTTKQEIYGFYSENILYCFNTIS